MADNLLMNTKCKCGELIRYIRMKKSGKLMPINDGIVKVINPEEPILLITDDGEMIRTKEHGDTGYEPHWSTCPFAGDFRKRAHAKAQERPKGEAGKTNQGSLQFDSGSSGREPSSSNVRRIGHIER